MTVLSKVCQKVHSLAFKSRNRACCRLSSGPISVMEQTMRAKSRLTIIVVEPVPRDCNDMRLQVGSIYH
jgi:hypothetical protein